MACKSCNLPLPEEGGEPKCTKCRHSFHLECANIKADLWRTMTKTKKKKNDWICNNCKVKESRSTRSATQSLSGDETCEEKTMLMFQKLLSKEFQEFEKRMNKKFADVEKSLKFSTGKMDDMGNSVKSIEQKMILIERRQEKVEAENTELKTKMKNMEVEVREMAQSMVNNKLEVSGLPTDNMDHMDIAMQVIDKVDLDPRIVGQYDVQKQVKPQERAGTKSSIIITFRSQEVRNQLFGKMKQAKIRLAVKDVVNNSLDNSPVYVNEYLSPYYRKLFYEAKKVKVEKNYAHLWVRGGKFFLKKLMALTIYVLHP